MGADNGATARETPHRDPPWLSPDISVPVVPPLINTASMRDPRDLEAVIAQFNVDTAERYRRRDVTGDGRPETFCNIYVSDLTMALCAPIPHRLGAEWQDVAANVRWMRKGYNGWLGASETFAQEQANSGHPSVVVYDEPGEAAHGHIALLVPSQGRQGVWITQAGSSNFRRTTLSAGFGRFTPLVRYFTHA